MASASIELQRAASEADLNIVRRPVELGSLVCAQSGRCVAVGLTIVRDIVRSRSDVVLYSRLKLWFCLLGLEVEGLFGGLPGGC